MATLYPNGGAMALAALVRTGLAAAHLRLFKAIAQPLSASTVIGDLTEADFDGYASATITAWLAAYLDPAGGASFQSGTKQFQFDSGTPIGGSNSVLGWYITNAGGALIIAGTFDAPVAMAADGDAIPLNVTLNYGR